MRVTTRYATPAARTAGVGRVAAGLLLLVGLLAGCGSAGRPEPAEDPARPVVEVASFDFPESQILAELYAQALEHRGLPVARIPALGSREIVEPALESGAVDLVPEYLGTVLNFLAGGAQEATADPKANHAKLVRSFAARGVTVLAFAAAQDRNGFVVTGETASRYRLARVSDLAPVARDLVFGGPPECPERILCLKGLRETYHLEFKDFRPMSSRAVTADALDAGEIDVGLMETTDPHVPARRLVQLVDDRALQPAENVVPVVRSQVVAAYGPRLVEAVDAVTAQLTTGDLASLNRRVVLDNQPVADAACDWLVRRGLVT